jgi:hypothetical protein
VLKVITVPAQRRGCEVVLGQVGEEPCHPVWSDRLSRRQYRRFQADFPLNGLSEIGQPPLSKTSDEYGSTAYGGGARRTGVWVGTGLRL